MQKHLTITDFDFVFTLTYTVLAWNSISQTLYTTNKLCKQFKSTIHIYNEDGSLGQAKSWYNI